MTMTKTKTKTEIRPILAIKRGTTRVTKTDTKPCTPKSVDLSPRLPLACTSRPRSCSQIRDRGIEIAEVTLHVGLGTFQPVRVERVEDHKLHREWYEIPAAAANAINRAKAEGRRVVAVGTTTVRTLEHAARQSELRCEQRSEERAKERTGELQIEAGQGEAEEFIYPGYRFRVVDALLTNFHLPQSTLLMLVCALGGKEFVMSAYRHAVKASYRFYSYGDCMFLE